MNVHPAPIHVAIFAAGLGKRMHSALPKALHLLAGKPLLSHVIDAARAIRPATICVVYGTGGEMVRNALAADDVVWVKQDPPLGTGDALRVALTALPDDGVTVAIIGDVPLISSDSLAELSRAAAKGLSVLTARVADPTGLGRIVRDANGGIRAIVEHRDASEFERDIDEINSGVLAAPTGLFRTWVKRLSNANTQGEYYLTDAVALAVADGATVTGVAVADADDVGGVNDRLQLAQAERLLQTRRAKQLLLSGVWIADPARFDLRGMLQCGRDVSIDVGCVFEGEVHLDDDVKIGAHCVLRNVRIARGTVVAPFSHLDDASVGANCRIGPYARLRPATILAEDVHIGNFVEVKASTIGVGSKANHLAYIGDSSVGSRVNVGAGTITCNYDGVNKHRTVIEDDVFIGSDTQIVAPVTVRRGATLGAGTTLTRDAPADQLTVSRSRQVSIAGWKRPVKK